MEHKENVFKILKKIVKSRSKIYKKIRFRKKMKKCKIRNMIYLEELKSRQITQYKKLLQQMVLVNSKRIKTLLNRKILSLHFRNLAKIKIRLKNNRRRTKKMRNNLIKNSQKQK